MATRQAPVVRVCLGHAFPASNGELHTYRICELTLTSDVCLAPLAAFRDSEAGRTAPSDSVARLREPQRTIFDDRGWVGGRLIRVTCHSGPSGYRVQVPSAGDFWVAAAGDRIEYVAEGAARDAELATHALLGPCLTLALALNGTFCLHASAVCIAGAAVAFVGESGAGKSTLASWLAERPNIHCVADDQLPIALTPPAATVKPYFPQWKRAQDQQWSGPERLPLAAVNLLLLTDPDTRLERSRAQRSSTLAAL